MSGRKTKSSEEKDAQAYLIREIDKLGISFNTTGSGFTKRGTPDLLCCIKGRFWGIEVKDKGKKATAIQAYVGEQIQKAGGSWTVVQGLQEAKELVERLRKEAQQ